MDLKIVKVMFSTSMESLEDFFLPLERIDFKLLQ